MYLKNKIGGKTFASGSGFVIDAHGSQVIVATNRHVVAPDLSELPARLIPKGSKPELEAVFRSAQGANQEESHPAQIIAADNSGNISKDLGRSEILPDSGLRYGKQPVSVTRRYQPDDQGHDATPSHRSPTRDADVLPAIFILQVNSRVLQAPG